MSDAGQTSKRVPQPKGASAKTIARVLDRYEAFLRDGELVTLAAASLGVDATPREVTLASVGPKASAATVPLERLAGLLATWQESPTKVAMMLMGYENEERSAVWRATVALGWLEGHPKSTPQTTSLALHEALERHVDEHGSARGRLEHAIAQIK